MLVRVCIFTWSHRLTVPEAANYL